jgi:hypothetical protein
MQIPYRYSVKAITNVGRDVVLPQVIQCESKSSSGYAATARYTHTDGIASAKNSINPQQKILIFY